MNLIEYNVTLNDNGRPCIDLPEDYEQKPEDRFFALEITRYILQDLMMRNKGSLDVKTVLAIDESERILGQISDEIAKIFHEKMRIAGNDALMTNNNYHVMVASIEERDNLPVNDIYYINKLFDRVNGFRVAVMSHRLEDRYDADVYEWDDEKEWVKQ